MPKSLSLQRTFTIAHKEVLHIIRDPMTLFLALFIPIVELLILGFAIDTNIRNIRTVILDEAKSQESRMLLDRFENTQTFHIVGEVLTDEELNRALVSGRARVGIKIPEHYSRRLLAGDTAQVLVVVDGSDSSTAGEAVNVGNLLTMGENLQQILTARNLRF